jgi:hypothetical protein
MGDKENGCRDGRPAFDPWQRQKCLSTQLVLIIVSRLALGPTQHIQWIPLALSVRTETSDGEGVRLATHPEAAAT